MKTRILLSAAGSLLSLAAWCQNEWNSTTNSTAAMYRDGFVAIGSGAPVTGLPFVVKNPNTGVGTKVAFGATGLQGGFSTGNAVLEVSSATPSDGTFLGLYAGQGASRSAMQFGVSPFGCNIYCGKGSSGTTQPFGIWLQGSSGLAEALHIDINGKVNIGALSGGTPGNYRLYVKDGILTEMVKVAVDNTSNWSDYVFAPGYHLKPLEEVADFIRKNKHLPNVPSAEEVVKEGLDVAAMDATLLEKIEELTLYLIDVKKEMAEMKQENTALKTELKALQQKIN